MSENHAGGRVTLCVVPTQHKVLSSWEAKIDLLLYDAGFDFEYEPETFDIGDRHYTPDFRVGEDIIEVKGYDWGHANERAEKFMERYPEYRYIVVGVCISCDIHIEWENRSSLTDILHRSG